MAVGRDVRGRAGQAGAIVGQIGLDSVVVLASRTKFVRKDFGSPRHRYCWPSGHVRRAAGRYLSVRDTICGDRLLTRSLGQSRSRFGSWCRFERTRS